MTDIDDLLAEVRRLDGEAEYDLRALSNWDTADVYRTVAEWRPWLTLLAAAVERLRAENARLRAATVDESRPADVIEIARLREVLDGIASPHTIDGENHMAAVKHARAALRGDP